MKTCFVTGATSGIGKATAEIFAENGWQLIICGRREERLEALKQELETKFKTPIYSFQLDVRNNNDVVKTIAAIPTAFRNIDVLVNNAGLAAGRDSFENGNLNDWEAMIDTNVKGLLYVSKCVANLMIENKNGGHIINIGSIAGKETYASGNVYCATKHAVDALSKAQRIDLLPYGIKVTNVAPGAVDTEFSLVRFKGDEEKANSTYNGFQPLLAEDVADVIYFAASRPAHVNLNDVLVMPTAQANATVIHKAK